MPTTTRARKRRIPEAKVLLPLLLLLPQTKARKHPNRSCCVARPFSKAPKVLVVQEVAVVVARERSRLLADIYTTVRVSRHYVPFWEIL